MNDKCQVLSADLVGRPAENLSGRVAVTFVHLFIGKT